MDASINIRLLGQEFTIEDEGDPERVRTIVDLVEEKVTEMRDAGMTGPGPRLAVLAALNVAEEVVDLRREVQKLNEAVTDSAERIVSAIEERAGL